MPLYKPFHNLIIEWSILIPFNKIKEKNVKEKMYRDLRENLSEKKNGSLYNLRLK